MNQLDLFNEGEIDLGTFFSRLDECRDKNPLSHSLHPYPAKYIPHIPRALIRAMSEPGATVADPMCGSGTTLIEASLLGRPSTGNDCNPIAVLAATAKTALLTREDEGVLESMVRWSAREASACAGDPARATKVQPPSTWPTFRNRAMWFADDAAAELTLIRAACRDLRESPARTVALAAFSAIIVASSFQESETRWRSIPREVKPGEVFRRFSVRLGENLQRLRDYAREGPAIVRVSQGNAQRLPWNDRSVDLVVSSPPYANSHDYYLYHKLRLFWLDEDVHSVQRTEIGSRHRHSDLKEDIGVYLSDMREVMRETARVLRPNGKAAYVVADSVIRGVHHDMGIAFRAIAGEVGLSCIATYTFDHKRFTSAFTRSFGTNRTKLTHVVCLARQ